MRISDEFRIALICFMLSLHLYDIFFLHQWEVLNMVMNHDKYSIGFLVLLTFKIDCYLRLSKLLVPYNLWTSF